MEASQTGCQGSPSQPLPVSPEETPSCLDPSPLCPSLLPSPWLLAVWRCCLCNSVSMLCVCFCLCVYTHGGVCVCNCVCCVCVSVSVCACVGVSLCVCVSLGGRGSPAGRWDQSQYLRTPVSVQCHCCLRSTGWVGWARVPPGSRGGGRPLTWEHGGSRGVHGGLALRWQLGEWPCEAP